MGSSTHGRVGEDMIRHRRVLPRTDETNLNSLPCVTWAANVFEEVPGGSVQQLCSSWQESLLNSGSPRRIQYFRPTIVPHYLNHQARLKGQEQSWTQHTCALSDIDIWIEPACYEKM